MKKNQVIYDAVFIKYKLNNEPTKRLKVDEVAGVKKQEQTLVIQLTQNREATIELDNYSENAIEEFRDLINNIIQINGNK